MRLLFVEDHKQTFEVISRELIEAGYSVDYAPTLATARDLIKTGGYALVILDWMLPDGDGPSLCRAMRSGEDSTPVLLLTARSSVEDRVSGLDAGADDFLKKPFAVAELLARVRALLRRAPRLAGNIVRIGNIEVRTAERRVVVEGISLPLTTREYEIFEELLRHEGSAVERPALLNAVWGAEEVDEGSAASLEVLIGRLRRKLESAGARIAIRTHRGVGYSAEGV